MGKIKQHEQQQKKQQTTSDSPKQNCGWWGQ